MDREDRIRELLNKRYRVVVEAQIASADALLKKHELFDANRKTVHASLYRCLSDIEKDLETLDKMTRKKIESLKTDYRNDQKKLEDDRKKCLEKHRESLKELDESNEQKRSLNMLKEEKIEHEHAIALSKIEPRYEEELAALAQRLKEAEAKYDDNMAQLAQDTELKMETMKKRFMDIVQELEGKNDRRKAQSDTEEDAISAKIARYETSLAGTIRELQASIHERVKPSHAALATLKKEQARDIKEINAYYKAEISKLEKYRKEKEKINEPAAAAGFGKDIKKLKKKCAEALDAKKTQHEVTLTPLLEKHEKIKADAQRRCFSVKTEGIEKITAYLNSLLFLRTKDKIETNDSNTDILKQQDKHDAKKQELTLEETIQRTNYEQTLEEAKLTDEAERTIARLKADLENEREIKRYRLEKNSVVKSRNYAKALHQKEMETAQTKHRFSLDERDIEKIMLSRDHAYHLDVAAVERNIEKVRKDYDKEHVLMRHYLFHAQNYTALKNDILDATRNAVETDIETRKNIRVDGFKQRLTQAERDHEKMVADIETTYKEEIVIYEHAYRAIEKEHQTSMQSLIEKQALERNKNIEHIESLDPKKDKKRIRQYRQNLSAKQESHDAALAIKKRELDNKRSLYQMMIDRIKHFRIQSLEEADTLLMHIRDQFNHAITDVEKLSAGETRTLENVQERTEHTAGLFETFQRQRQDQTHQLSETYLARRTERETDAKTALYRTLAADIARHKDHIAALKENTEKQLEDIGETFRDTCATIEKTELETSRAIEEETGDEIRRIESRIQREKRQFETALKSRAAAKEKDIAACYARKDAIAKAREDSLLRRDEESAKARETYEKDKQDDLAALTQRCQQLIKTIEQDAVNIIGETDVPRLKVILQGTEPMDDIDR